MAINKIVGLENEYGFAAFGHDNGEIVARPAALVELAPALLQLVHELGNGWKSRHSIDRYHLRNGGLAYCDTGNHPEYATPECADALQLVAADRAGERLFAAAVKTLIERGDLSGPGGAVTDCNIFKHNADFGGNTFGTHENYCASAQLTNDQYARPLLTFLASRPLIAGSGGLVRRNDSRAGYRFVLSPRALHIAENISNRSTLDRPMYNLRDEPLADKRRFRRIHLLSGDANRCDVSTLLKVGTTAIVLAMIEDGFVPKGLEVDSPVDALHAVSMRPEAQVALADGRLMTPLEIQYQFCDAAFAYADRVGLEACGGPVAKAVLTRWAEVLNVLERGEWRELFGVLDWPTKRAIFERRTDRLLEDGATAGEIRRAIRGEELAYSNIMPSRSSYEALRSRGRIECLLPTEPEIESTTPVGTRAQLRATLMLRWPEALRHVNWNQVIVTVENSDITMEMSDPTLSDPAEIDRLAELPHGTPILNAIASALPRRFVELTGSQRDPSSLSVLQRFCDRQFRLGGDNPDLREACYESGRAAIAELAEQVHEPHSPRFYALLHTAQRGFALAGCPEQLISVIRSMRDRVGKEQARISSNVVFQQDTSTTGDFIPEREGSEQRVLRLDRVINVLSMAIAEVEHPSLQHRPFDHGRGR